MRSIHTAALSAIVGATMSLTAPAHAEQTSLFILDTSGSMWGKLADGQTKITVARKVLGDLAAGLPDSVSAGLIAYGHRRKGDCSDIEIVQPVAAAGGPGIASRLNGLTPRGKTPISDALKLAGETLTGREEERTIVLVSDGIETCKGDPCAVAEALRNSASNLKIHVVGYGVDAEARAQLQCVAQKGGGAYFDVDDTAALSGALTEVAESITTDKEIVVEAPKVENTSTTIQLQIAGPGTIRINLADWATQAKYWKVVEPETGEEVAKTNELEMPVMAGEYQLVWRQVEHGGQEIDLPKVVTVDSGQVTEVDINTGAQFIAPEGIDRPYYWQLLPNAADAEKIRGKRNVAAHYSVWYPVPVPQGEYTVILRQKEHGYSDVNLGKMTFEEGKLTQVPLDQGLNLQWNDNWENIYYLLMTDEAGREHKFRKRGPVILAPGRYKIALRLTEHNHSEAEFGEIVVGETGFVDAQLTSGIKFNTKIEGEIAIFAVDLESGEEAKIHWSRSSSNPWPAMPLGAGRYRFDMLIKGSKRMTIAPEIEIKPGQFITANM